MSKNTNIQAIRGMNDIGPNQAHTWLWLERTLTDMATAWGYHMIRTPVVEKTALFKRGVGDSSDIVQKEMYTFLDRGDESVCLRPEGTASCVRAGIEHGWLYNQRQKWFYLGPMFRRERPQKGRYRQFHHFGLEVLGVEGPGIEAELLQFTHLLWQKLGLSGLKLHIHSLGDSASRTRYREQLVTYFSQHKDQLDADSLRRLESNPLRILDSKVAQTQALVQKAPKLLDALSEPAKARFAETLALLDALQIPYHIDPYLVRGLDYYQDIVFEWVSHDLGAQGTVCAGGRYDGLIEQLGGHPSHACGFAIGLERLLDLIPQTHIATAPTTVSIGTQSKTGQQAALKLATQLRSALPMLSIITDPNPDKPKKHIKRALGQQSKWLIMVESDDAHYVLRALHDHQPDQTLTLQGLIEQLRSNL